MFSVKRQLVSAFARAAVLMILLGTSLLVAAAGAVRRVVGGGRANERIILMTGTFYNVGWFRSHIHPLARCAAFDKVIVVCDEPLFAVPKVAYVCPSGAWVRVLGRPLARLLWIASVARRERPGYLMGYHIMPNALICLVVARGFGLRAIYQMTGGPNQIVRGGALSENKLLRRQGRERPGRLREALLFHIVRQFDFLVVRGSKAAAFARLHRLPERCFTIPGSVDTSRFLPDASRKVYDLVSVGRLVPAKQYDLLLDIVARLAQARSDTRVAIVGDGYLHDELLGRANELGIASCVEFLGQRDDVVTVLRQSRLFVLTSRNEGLSIAMLEAMATGLPAVVPDIGDLADVVIPDKTGIFIDCSDPAGAADAIRRLLDDPDHVETMSREARRCAVEYCEIGAVAARWDAELIPGQGSMGNGRCVEALPASGSDRSHHEEVVKVT